MSAGHRLTPSPFRKEVRQVHGQGAGQGQNFVIGHWPCAGLDFRDLGARQNDGVSGNPTAQVLLRNPRSCRTTNFTKAWADQVPGMVWFFALQNVLVEHID